MDKFFSESDRRKFIFSGNMEALTAVGNDGTVYEDEALSTLDGEGVDFERWRATMAKKLLEQDEKEKKIAGQPLDLKAHQRMNVKGLAGSCSYHTPRLSARVHPTAMLFRIWVHMWWADKKEASHIPHPSPFYNDEAWNSFKIEAGLS